MTTEYKDAILDEMFKIQNTLTEVFVVTVDKSGEIRYRSSFSNTADDLYCLEATKFQIMQNEFNNFTDQEEEDLDDSF